MPTIFPYDMRRLPRLSVLSVTGIAAGLLCPYLYKKGLAVATDQFFLEGVHAENSGAYPAAELGLAAIFISVVVLTNVAEGFCWLAGRNAAPDQLPSVGVGDAESTSQVTLLAPSSAASSQESVIDHRRLACTVPTLLFLHLAVAASMILMPLAHIGGDFAMMGLITDRQDCEAAAKVWKNTLRVVIPMAQFGSFCVLLLLNRFVMLAPQRADQDANAQDAGSDCSRRVNDCDMICNALLRT